MQDIAEDPNVEDWINGVSFVQTTETIYRNPALWAEYEPLLQEMEQLGQQLDELAAQQREGQGDDAGEESLGGEPGPVAAPVGEESLGEELAEDPDTAAIHRRFTELKAEADAVQERYAADCEVWHLRALDREEEITPIVTEVGVPTAPRPLGKGASPQKRTAWMKRMRTFEDEMRVTADEVNVRCIALATLKVVVAGEEKPAPSADGVRALLKRPGGKKHFRQLVGAVERISLKEVEFAAPHRPGA